VTMNQRTMKEDLQKQIADFLARYCPAFEQREEGVVVWHGCYCRITGENCDCVHGETARCRFMEWSMPFVEQARAAERDALTRWMKELAAVSPAVGARFKLDAAIEVFGSGYAMHDILRAMGYIPPRCTAATIELTPWEPVRMRVSGFAGAEMAAWLECVEGNVGQLIVNVVDEEGQAKIEEAGTTKDTKESV